jgi:hypothetical protein
MAVIDFVEDTPAAGEAFPEGVRVIKWSLASGDTGKPYPAPHRSDKTVQISGTAGAGSTVTIQGTLVADGSTDKFGTLNNPAHSALSWNDADLTANKIEGVLENVYRIRPNFSAGTATAVVVRLLITTTARR